MQTTASQHGTPLYITVWDLSPPSSLSAAAYRLFGLGIFHTNLWLPDLSVEYAFGGHVYRGTSGIFSIPRDPVDPSALALRILADERGGTPKCKAEEDADGMGGSLPETVDGMSWLGPSRVPCPGRSPIPDARYMGAYFMGYVGEPVEQIDGMAGGIDPYHRWTAAQSGPAAFREPPELCERFFLSLADRDRDTRGRTAPVPAAEPSSLSDGSTAGTVKSVRRGGRHPRHGGRRLASIEFALRTMRAWRSDPVWTGPEYDLLSRNCNHFTEAACLCLVGARLPAWINRSAAVGRSVVWVVPRGLLEIETGIDRGDVVSLSEEGEEQEEGEDEVGQRSWAREIEGMDGLEDGTPVEGERDHGMAEGEAPLRKSHERHGDGDTDGILERLEEEKWAAELASTYAR